VYERRVKQVLRKILSNNIEFGASLASQTRQMIWFLIAIIIIILITVACTVPRLRGSVSQQKSARPFTPDPHNDKQVFVQGWDETEMRKIIADFVKAYENDGYPPYSIEPHKQNDKLFRLQFPSDIHPLLFTFLVNYIAYPFDLDPENRRILVAGTTTLTRGYDGLDDSLIGRMALFYLPENDQDHDVVYMHFSDRTTYANSFNDLVWRRVSDARLSPEVTRLVAPF